MESKSVTLTASRQITLPSLIAKTLEAKPGDKIYFVVDEKTGNVTLKTRKQLVFEMVSGLEQDRNEAIQKNPEIAKKIKQHAGMSFEEIRDEWAHSPEGKKYYKEKYGLEL